VVMLAYSIVYFLPKSINFKWVLFMVVRRSAIMRWLSSSRTIISILDPLNVKC